MNKNRKIILTISISVIVLFLFFVLKSFYYAPQKVVKEENTTTTATEQTSTSTPTKTQSVSVKDTAWTVFQKYLGYNKDHNLDAVKSIVYKVNIVCAGATLTDECKNRMDMAHSYGSALKKDDFTNIWSDSKQIILATDFKIDENDTAIGRNRAIMFFVKNDADKLVLLSFSPFKGYVLPKTASTTREELLGKLTDTTKDTDKDGIADYEEQCISPYDDSTCLKTNQNIRDTDGNGYWDGVQILMK